MDIFGFEPLIKGQR